jgi:hypothetical protein
MPFRAADSGPRAAEETMSTHPSSSGLEPHRGQMIMILGILSIVVLQIILGPITWIMANGDLKKMDQGIMDPAGRDNTKLGKTCAMVGTVIGLAGLLITLLFCVCLPIIGIGAISTRP